VVLIIRASESTAGDRTRGHVLVVHSESKECSGTKRDALAVCNSGAINKVNSRREGGKGYRSAIVTVAIAVDKIFNDKPSVRLAEQAGGDVAEALVHLLASGQVLQHGRAAGRGGRHDRHSDLIAFGDANAHEGI